jgi:hypothetical protein
VPDDHAAPHRILSESTVLNKTNPNGDLIMRKLFVSLVLATASATPLMAAEHPEVTLQQLQTEVTALQKSVAILQGSVTTASLSGNYAFIGYQGEIDTGDSIQQEIYTGTCTLSSDLTYACTTAGSGYKNKGGSTGSFSPFTETGAPSGTWALTAGQLVVTPTSGTATTFALTAGGTVAVSTQASINTSAANSQGGDTTLIVLLRVQ